MLKLTSKTRNTFKGMIFLLCSLMFFSCKEQAQEQPEQLPLTVDFLQISIANADVAKKYPGAIEGSVNVDLKAQVSGYLEKIFVKEGDYVQKGQALFKIKAEVFNEQVNNSSATLKAALAAQANAKLEVEKIRPLVEGKVVSEIQLQTAEANYEAASAQVTQAKAMLNSSKINAEFSLIKAPISGYIGRIPNRIGNLVTPTDLVPLTTLSDINQIFVYFSLTEADYIAFMKEKGLQKNINTVSLVMADGSEYAHKGKLEFASGNIDRTTGSIALKAIFPNPDKLLRSGGSAGVILQKAYHTALLVPMASVKDIQDKYFVFSLADSNKVAMKPFEIEGKSGSNYIVKSGISEGEKIALTSIDVLNEGMTVIPKITKSSLGK
ncbi:efflux RND transporter periplasmic adaptor subunit [Arcicella aquatica]|uniref:Efflux RND transporter periplasmic adaptor subunit n=1 Tax=Arcicella aquatica TaxID=217141 RepID=A0ABU5QTR2_9BACT|nr:efflux RND transporter periplasmic adaptor subunit [Arcicella aquatica]MEA5260109.1 efflux RND transporter periplasmic adaptor subunit [Arcicella aquatica]